MKETKTTYAYKLKYLENPTFDKVRNFAKKFIDELPKELVDELYSQLERGVVQIDSEPQMLVYLYSFGNMHQAKLNKAFENIPEILFDQPEINIIDYGCGQAIGTMCYVDFIRQKKCIRSNTNNTVQYRNTKSMSVLKAENNNVVVEYGHDNRIGGSHAWFRCGSLFGYVTTAADEAIQDAGGFANACDTGTIQYTEAQGSDGKWYPQIISTANPSIHYRNTKSILALKEEYGEVIEGRFVLAEISYGHSNAFGGSHAWFKCGKLGPLYVTQNAEQAIQEAGGCSEACEAGTIQYTEQLGNDGKWYPVLTRSDNAFGAKKGVLQKVKRVTLIEPSEICLKRAALHVSKFCPDAEIVTVNKSFDDLDAADIVCDDNIPTLHILSNVLDLLVFDLERFAGVINEKIKGFNQIVCVSPFFGFSDKDMRMREFCALLNGEENYSKFFDKYELNPNKPWTAQIRCFSVANLEEDLSTEVTDEDIDNGFKDEYGVVYSRYGKRLLKCKNMGLKPYIVKNGTKVICNGAFYNCASLQQITIPNSVTSIGVSAFDYCDLLQQIIIPEGSESKFSQMLPKKIWNKLYCLKQVRVVEPQVGGDDLPF